MERITIKDLKKRLDSLDSDLKRKACAALVKSGIDLSERNNALTGTKVSGFYFEKQFYEADSHKSVFLQLTEIVLRRIPQSEQDKILTIRGTKKKYFSRSPKDFRHFYEKIPETQFYADTNENAAALNKRCQKILILFEIDPASFKIKYH